MSPTLSYRRIEATVRCTCGASLCGLSPTDRCPACNRLVLAAHWSRVASADTHWLQTLKHGCVWLTFGNQMMCVVFVVLTAACNAVDADAPNWLRSLPDLPIALGAWMIATPASESEARQARPHIRLFLWIRLMAASFIFFSILQNLPPDFCDYNDEEYLIVRHLHYGWQFCWIGMCVGLTLRARQLADRMDLFDTKFAATCAMIFVILGSLSCVAGLDCEFADDNPWKSKIITWESDASDLGGYWNFLSRVLLFCLAVYFWGVLNRALRRLEITPGLKSNQSGSRLAAAPVLRRSAWGKLAATTS